jgi:Tyrosyl-tRNA synthetase
MPGVTVAHDTWNLVQFLTDVTKIEPSRRQAREDINNGAIYVNGFRQQDVDFEVNPDGAFEGKFIIIRKGKKKYTLVRIEK